MFESEGAAKRVDKEENRAKKIQTPNGENQRNREFFQMIFRTYRTC